jgi:hypothetical protein
MIQKFFFGSLEFQINPVLLYCFLYRCSPFSKQNSPSLFHLQQSLSICLPLTLAFMQLSVLSEHENDNLNPCTTDKMTFQFMNRLISLSPTGTEIPVMKPEANSSRMLSGP